MSNKSLRVFMLSTALLIMAACAAAPPAPNPGPPPLQNMLGSTDELQLLTELSLDLASRYGSENLLVVLEIENTLLANSLEMVTGEFPTGSLRPFQPDTAEQVRRMQDAGLKVIAVTSLGSAYEQQMRQEMSRNAFNFQASAWPPTDGYAESFIATEGTDPVFYQDGIFFVAGQNSGEMLKALLEKSGTPYPKLILMLDHSQAHLNEVMQAFSWSGTKVHAWRYTREDAPVVALDH